MEQEEKKTFGRLMRALHRDVGFFVVGLVIVYAISGIVLLYRDTGFMMRDVQVERQLPAGLGADELAKALHLRGFKVSKVDGDVVYFRGGTYNKSTGAATYSTRQFPFFLQKLMGFHKTMSRKISHWFALIFSILLCFLAVSSFWMYRRGSRPFRRGLCIAAAGGVLTAIVLFL